MHARLFSFILLLTSIGPTVAIAAEPVDRDRIEAGRAEADERYRQEEARCRERFVVTSCVDAARAERRATLARLREREIALDTERRRERAAQRAERVRQKRADVGAAPVPTRPSPSIRSGSPAPGTAGMQRAPRMGNGPGVPTTPEANLPAAPNAERGSSVEGAPNASAQTPDVAQARETAASGAAPEKDAQALPANAGAPRSKPRSVPAPAAAKAPPPAASRAQPLSPEVRERNRSEFEAKQERAEQRRQAAEERAAGRKAGKATQPLPAPEPGSF